VGYLLFSWNVWHGNGVGLYRNGSFDFRSKFNDGRLGVLARRDFRRFYIGYSTSLLGTALSSVAIAFAVLSNGGTPTGLGVVFAANIAAMLAFMLGGGALADRSAGPGPGRC
jgi:hypothetical protein